jgi:uncharacterized membrane protein
LSSLESSKTLAGIGTILLIFSAVPIVGIIGMLLLIVGLKGLSEYYKDNTIYQSAIFGVIYGVVGIIALSAGVFGSVLSSMFSSIAAGSGLGAILGLFAFLLVLVIAFIFFVLMAMKFRRCFNAVADRSGEQLFRTAGTLLFVGAFLTIILVGTILIFIAWIIATIAFFSVRSTPQPYSYVSLQTANQPPTIQATRYCPNCGAPADQNALFCPHCGRQLPSA